MNKKQILLIWDIDGTLIQGRGIGRRAMDKAFLELYGINNGFDGIDMAGRLDALILKDAYSFHGIKDAESKDYFETYCKHLRNEIDILSVPIDAPGILKLMEKLSAPNGFYNVLGTGNLEAAARIKLAKHNMNSFFPTGGFGDREAERWEIIGDAIENAQKHYGIDFRKQNTYVIGDTPKDMECGIKLGIKSIGVATGTYSVEELLKCEPDFIFEDFTEPEKFLSVFY